MTKLIFAGGIFNLLFAVFHLFFWKLFNWKYELKSISFVNRNIMQVLNLCLAFVFVIFFKLKSAISWILLILFIAGTLLYGLPFFLK